MTDGQTPFHPDHRGVRAAEERGLAKGAATQRGLRGLVILLTFLGLFHPGGAHALAAEDKMISTIQKEGQTSVRASELERETGIVIKDLPGAGQLAVCREERCAILKVFFKEAGDTFVPVAELAQALRANAEFDLETKRVRFVFQPLDSPALEAVAAVGALAPNFRLTTLDGDPVELSDFRGQRVLINSWASW